jgi:integrase
VRERLTVTHWSPHDLRRTGRTMLAAMGCPHEIGEAILGHVVPGVAGDYNLYRYDKERVQWLAALDARLESIVTQPAQPPA